MPTIAEKLETIAENEQKVYNKGVADGKQSEYDAFWDEYQTKGKRNGYQHAFAGVGWNKNTLKPKYNITVRGGYMMFHNFNRYGSPLDLVDKLAEVGVNLDLSRCTDANYLFYAANVSRVGTINLTLVKSLDNIFNSCTSLVTIEKLMLNGSGEQKHNYTFYNCKKLENINEIQGKIGRTASLESSPLTVETAKRVINALVNYKGSASELTYKITLNRTVWEALNEAEAPPSGNTWQQYVETLGWLYA